MKRKQKAEKADIRKIILQTISVVGVLTVAAVAPNALQLFKHLDPDQNERRNRRRRYYMKTVVKKLVDQGFIEFKETGKSKKYLRLTEKGRKQLIRYQIGDLQIKKPKKWDGKYRLVVFDIKEKRRASRDQLRYWLKRFGFVQIQQSVWVCAYPCHELVLLLKSYYGLGSQVIYMTVNEIENDGEIRKRLALT